VSQRTVRNWIKDEAGRRVLMTMQAVEAIDLTHVEVKKSGHRKGKWKNGLTYHSDSAVIINVMTDKSTEFYTRTILYKKKLLSLSPRANYTDQATAACRRI
jgi:hypothetical protein